MKFKEIADALEHLDREIDDKVREQTTAMLLLGCDADLVDEHESIVRASWAAARAELAVAAAVEAALDGVRPPAAVPQPSPSVDLVCVMAGREQVN